MPPVPVDEPLGYVRGGRLSYSEAVGTALIRHGHAIVNSPPPNHSPQPKDQSVRYGGPYSSTPWDRPRRVIAKVEHHLGELFPRVGFIVTTLGTNRAVVRFYNQRATAEQWIKEGKAATHWTRLSCHRFRANEVRPLPGVIAYNPKPEAEDGPCFASMTSLNLLERTLSDGLIPPVRRHEGGETWVHIGNPRPSLDYSRTMKEKSHRVSRRCYRSGVDALRDTQTRRLDGHTLYSASHLQIRTERQAAGRRLRPVARQLRWWGAPAQGDRHPVRVDQAAGGVSRGRPPAGQGPASNARIAPATTLWPRLRLRRLQRRHPAGRRCDPQAPARARSPRRAGPGFAADALAVRERRRGAGPDRHGSRPGGHRHRAPSAAAQGPRHPHHDRPGSDRRSHPRPAGVHLLQWPLRHVVLPARRGHGDVQRGGRAVCRRRGPATRQCAGQPRGLWPLAASDSAAARGVSLAHDPGAVGWGLRDAHGVRVPRGRAGRIRRGHAEQHAAGEARPPLDGQSADALQSHGPDRAPLRGDALRGQDVETQAAGDHQGRGRAASPARTPGQSPGPRDPPAPHAPDELRG